MSEQFCCVCRFARVEILTPEEARLLPKGVTAQFYCQRRAPIADAQTSIALWPEVNDEDWCGEFEPA